MADMKTPATAVTKRPARTPLYTAARVLAAVEDRGGDGGIICVPAHGEGVVGRNACAQMDWGYAFGDTRVTHS